jgi:LDH2 family malate/lactate/ureidoglycolate dehydrogenase
MPGLDEVRLPGERSAEIEEERKRTGIPIGPELAPQLRQLAEELGVAPL